MADRFFVFRVMRVMPFVMGGCVLQLVIYTCVGGSVLLGFAKGVVDKLDG